MPGSATALAATLFAAAILPASAQFEFATNNGVLTLTSYTGAGGAVVIPANSGGLPVVAIGPNAFLQKQTVTSVAIPNTVTNIDFYAFSGCSSLASVTIPNSVASIGIHAFSSNSALTAITLPDALSKIENYAFAECTSLTNIVFPAGLTEIGWNAFNGCSSLTSVAVPEGVLLLGSKAFFNCANLTRVILPKSLIYILQLAFAECPALKEVYVRGDAPGYGLPDLFDGSPLVTVFYMPGTIGWSPVYSLRPTVLWNPQMQPVKAPVGSSNPFQFLITGATNLTVIVEGATNLTTAPWIPLQTNNLASGPSPFNDQQSTNLPQRFYRLRAP